MTVQPLHDGALVPRPEATPEALHAAIAVLAPDRLHELAASKDEALLLTAREDNADYSRLWITTWMAEVEILRRPELARRLRSAQQALEETTDRQDPAFRAAMNEILAVRRTAEAAVNA